jgi:hypothetical protein
MRTIPQPLRFFLAHEIDPILRARQPSARLGVIRLPLDTPDKLPVFSSSQLCEFLFSGLPFLTPLLPILFLLLFLGLLLGILLFPRNPSLLVPPAEFGITSLYLYRDLLTLFVK